MQVCFHCGELTDPSENYCQKCGATLPKLAYTVTDIVSVDKVFDLYHKFRDQAGAVKAGAITLEDFENFMVDMQDKLMAQEENIRNYELDDSIIDDFEEELEVGFQGIDAINEGMEIMFEYVDDENPVHLDEGLELINEGLELIHRARIINRVRDKRLSADADAYKREESIEL